MSIFSGYFIYQSSDNSCFNNDINNSTLAFTLIFTGFVSFLRQSLFIAFLFLGFPFLVYLFTTNPTDFYTNIGIDPEIVNNLPTFPAQKSHCSIDDCIICQEVINEGDELLMLRCPGK